MKLHCYFESNIPTQHSLSAILQQVSSIILELNKLNSCHIAVNSPASLQPYSHHVMAPAAFPHLLRIYLLATDESFYSLEQWEMACGLVVFVVFVVVVQLSVKSFLMVNVFPSSPLSQGF